MIGLLLQDWTKSDDLGDFGGVLYTLLDELVYHTSRNALQSILLLGLFLISASHASSAQFRVGTCSVLDKGSES